MSVQGFSWEVMPGLPPYGDAALAFSTTGQGKHHEGYVVRFGNAGSSWTGNFQRGWNKYDAILAHPNGHDVIVIAGGNAYVVDPASRGLVHSFGASIEFAAHVPGIGALVLGNGLWFEIFPARGEIMRTRRISWDGMREVRVAKTQLLGEACSPHDDDWYPFTVDLETGEASGGSYDGPPM